MKKSSKAQSYRRYSNYVAVPQNSYALRSISTEPTSPLSESVSRRSISECLQFDGSMQESKRYGCLYKKVSFYEAWDLWNEGRTIFFQCVDTIDTWWGSWCASKRSIRLAGLGPEFTFKVISDMAIEQIQNMLGASKLPSSMRYFVKI